MMFPGLLLVAGAAAMYLFDPDRGRRRRALNAYRVNRYVRRFAELHFDVTRAVEPLERTAQWQPGEPAETYPYGV
jgi:hypothetical protein